MKVFNKIYRLIRSIILRVYYSIYTPKNGINKNNRQVSICVSVTSYTPRLKKLVICLRSILNQTIKPDRIVVYLGNDVKHEDIPNCLFKLKTYGVIIKEGYKDLKPHKKYLYAMEEFPDDIIITIDDDGIYDRNLLKNLLVSFDRFPNAISACRVHRILFRDGKVAPYVDWNWDVTTLSKPSKMFMATGVGGVLYPPHILPKSAFNISDIMEKCLNADDIWLKMNEIMGNIPVVWAQTNYIHPIALDKVNNSGLNDINVLEGRNDLYIKRMMEDYNITLEMFSDAND